jgi:hypothetical protein
MLSVSAITVGSPSITCPECGEATDLSEERDPRGTEVNCDGCDKLIVINKSASLVIG